MNTLKTGLFTLGLIIGATSFAQKEAAITVKEGSEMQTEHLAKDLALTPEQKEKVLHLNQGLEQKNNAITSNTALTTDQKKASLQSNNNAKREQMKAILTAEQYKKYLEIETKEVHTEHIKKEEQKVNAVEK